MSRRWETIDMTDAERRAVVKLLRREVEQPHEFVENLSAREIVAARALLMRLQLLGDVNR